MSSTRRRISVLFFWMVAACLPASPAFAWDAATHRLVTSLAVESLPAGALKDFFVKNEKRLEGLSVEPDSKLKKTYGKLEERRHYIDSENYGHNPFSVIVEDR